MNRNLSNLRDAQALFGLNILIALGGCGAIVAQVAVSSEAKNSWLFGLSPERLVLVGFSAMLTILFMALALRAAPLARLLERWLRTPGVLSLTLINGLCAAILSTGAVILCLVLPAQPLPALTERLGVQASMLVPVLIRLTPLVGLICGVIWAYGLWLLAFYGSALPQEKLQITPTLGALVIWLAGALALAHWVVLALRLEWFAKIPGWYWTVAQKPYALAGVAWLTPVILAAALFALRAARNGGSSRVGLVAALVVGLALQWAAGQAMGHGIESLRERVFTSHHKAYAQLAATSNQSVAETVRDYEMLYGNTMFPSTKPPGVMAVYVGLERLVNAGLPAADAEARFLNLSQWIAVVFPWVSLLTVAAGWALTRRLKGPGDLAALLVACAPNYVLFSLFLDQALYPALFTAGALLADFSARKGSVWLGAATGVYLYLAAFMSFSMLPLFFLAAVMLAFHALRGQWLPMFRVGAGMFIGVLSGAGIFWLALGYNPLTRYQAAMRVVQNYDFYYRVGQTPGEPVAIAQRLEQLATAAGLNLVEVGSVVSFPVYILFIASLLWGLWRVLKKNQRPALDALFLGLILTFLAQNASGATRGEAARLWLFWLPTIASLACLFFDRLRGPTHRSAGWAAALLLAQGCTLILTFGFQDLLM